MFVKQHGTGTKSFIGFHGWSGNHRTFDSLISFLPQNATFYSYDLPGCGISSAPTKWDITNIVEMLNNSLEKIGNPPFSFIGNCSGAIIGLKMAQRNPNLFNRLVLIDPFAFMPWYFSIFLNKYFGKKAYFTTFANPIGRWITNNLLSKRRTDQTDLTKSFEEVNHTSVYEYLRILRDIGEPEQFANISVPIDLLYGENTFGAVKESIKIWKGIFPNANIYELKRAGHLPIEEATEQVAEILFRFKKV